MRKPFPLRVAEALFLDGCRLTGRAIGAFVSGIRKEVCK